MDDSSMGSHHKNHQYSLVYRQWCTWHLTRAQCLWLDQMACGQSQMIHSKGLGSQEPRRSGLICYEITCQQWIQWSLSLAEVHQGEPQLLGSKLNHWRGFIQCQLWSLLGNAWTGEPIKWCQSIDSNECQKQLAERFMGAAAYQGTFSLLKPEVGWFVCTPLLMPWNRYRKTIKRDMIKISKNVELVHEARIDEYSFLHSQPNPNTMSSINVWSCPTKGCSNNPVLEISMSIHWYNCWSSTTMMRPTQSLSNIRRRWKPCWQPSITMTLILKNPNISAHHQLMFDLIS